MIKKIFFYSIFLFYSIYVYAQEIKLGNATQFYLEEQIAASQGEAAQLLYSIEGLDIPDIDPSHFYNEKECVVRFGLPNFFQKIKQKKEVTVAFIGGSITKGDFSYRLQICKYIEKQYPQVKFKWINAGVSGTGTDLGAFRLDEHVLSYNPDLVFIEFSVNGAYQKGLEGIIRKIIKYDANIDMCVLHAISAAQTKIYQQNKFPNGVIRMEEVAEYYEIPSIHLAYETSMLDGEGKICWNSSTESVDGKIPFSKDGLHPMVDGGNLYAAAIARGLKKMENMPAGKHVLPAPQYGILWDEAKMYLPQDIAVFDDKWNKVKTEETQLLGFKDWFANIETSEEKESSFSFKFEGDMFGLFDIGGPECGQIEIFVDGSPYNVREVREGGFRRYEKASNGSNIINRFNKFCNNRYRGQHDVICVANGKHEVTIKISSKTCDKKAILGKGNLEDINSNPSRYNKTTLFLGRILVRGKAL